jgi:hypothetical protein
MCYSNELAAAKKVLEAAQQTYNAVLKKEEGWISRIMPGFIPERVITPTGHLVYTVNYEEIEFSMTVDFQPLFDKYNLHEQDNFVLCHWHGTPVSSFNLRHFGVLEKKNGKVTYQVLEADNMEQSSLLRASLIQVNDGEHKGERPTSAIMFHECHINIEDGRPFLCDNVICTPIEELKEVS